MTTASEGPRNLAEALEHAERLQVSLNSRLSSYRDDTSRLRPEVARLYDELVARLAMLDAGAIGPQVGEPLPEFALPDQDGRLITLSSLLRAGPAVISFNRGHWCPYCKLDLRALTEASGDITRRGARIASIMPERAEFTGAHADRLHLPFPILSDMDLGYALSLGLIFWVGSEVQRLYEEVGVTLDRYQGNGSFFLPMAAKFIVGRDGRITARQVNIEFRARMEPAEIIAALDALRAQ
jgi:peroxiredoxin